jgi:assimilatory nitrate reductase catalytic subunit
MHLPEPFVELHPADAQATGLDEGDFARVATAHGSCILKVVISEGQLPGSVFVPIHWSGETASCARVGDLVAAHTDPHSGQPEAKATPAAISPVVFSVRGFARTRERLAFPPGTWWVRTAVAQGFEYRLATSLGPLHWHDFAFAAFSDRAQVVEELVGATYSAGAFVAGEPYGCLCVGPMNEPLRLADLSPADAIDAGAYISSGTSMVHAAKPIVCACFQVELAAVRDAIARGQARTVAQIGRTLRAGTNCGSCLTDLKRLINEHRAAA